MPEHVSEGMSRIGVQRLRSVSLDVLEGVLKGKEQRSLRWSEVTTNVNGCAVRLPQSHSLLTVVGVIIEGGMRSVLFSSARLILKVSLPIWRTRADDECSTPPQEQLVLLAGCLTVTSLPVQDT